MWGTRGGVKFRRIAVACTADHQVVARAFAGPTVARESPPTKTVRMRPTTRPNLPDSSDESEGGVIEAFRKKKAREDQLGKVEAEAGVATANTMTVGPPAVLPAGCPSSGIAGDCQAASWHGRGLRRGTSRG